jgi:hypothetical protein
MPKGDSWGFFKNADAVTLTASAGSIGIAGQIAETGNTLEEGFGTLARRYRSGAACRAGDGLYRVAAHDHPREAMAALGTGVIDGWHGYIIESWQPLVNCTNTKKRRRSGAGRPPDRRLDLS